MSLPILPAAPATLAEGAGLAVTLAAPVDRIVLCARDGSAALGKALGLALPDRIGARAQDGAREALRLGPDEWALTLPGDMARETCETLACTGIAHSAVDVSSREVRLGIAGAGAVTLLSMGCPRDLSAVPVGEGRRTVFDGASVVIRRDAPDVFTMDVWRSFAPHAAALLIAGVAELAAEAEAAAPGA